MISVALGVVLLCVPAQGADELEAALSLLEKRVESIRDFRASFSTTTFSSDPRTKEMRSRTPLQGDLAYRAPGRTAWSARITDTFNAHQAYAPWVDPKGYRGALDAVELRLHIPWGLHVPEDFGGLTAREHHGAVYYRAALDTHSPAPIPLLAQPPEFHPLLFLFELSPRAILGRLPSLKFSQRKTEEGKTFIILTARPVDARDAARVDESERRRDETWMRGEVWIDEAEGALDRVILEYEHAGAAPRHRYEHVFKYGRRVGGIATLISSSWMQLELKNLRSNVGLKDEELRIDFPADAIVRDWVAQPQEVYDQRLKKDPADASAWLSFGTLRFRQQNYAAAVEAFKKVVELRPKAPEGYVALAYFLKERRVADDVRDFLKKAVQAGANFPVLRLALAHSQRGDKALPHFEAVLKQVGEDPEILENMIYLASYPTPEGNRRHYFRLFKAEIAQNHPTFGYVRWENIHPTIPEQLELAGLYEAALAKDGGSPWMRRRLIDLYVGAKKPDAARRQAEAVTAFVDREEAPQTEGAADRALEFFVVAKDWDSAARLQKAYAAKPGDAAKKIAGLYETEILAGRGTMDELKKLVDERVKPEWNPKEKLSFSPTFVRLMRVLQREKRATEFAQKIVESIGDDDNRPMYVHIVEAAVKEFYVPHAEGQALTLRLKEKTTGAAAGAADLVNLARQFGYAKQWTQAADKATQALALKDLSGPQRVSAELVLAECHDAAGAFEQAVAACDRALEVRDIPMTWLRSRMHELRARALAGAKRPRDAADAYGRAFGELLTEKHLETRWRAIQELRRNLQHPPEFRKDVEAAAAARPEDPGLRLLLVAALDWEGRTAPAAEALASLAPGDGFLLRELGIHWARAGDAKQALAARSAFLAVREAQRAALQGVQSDAVTTLDWHIVSALENPPDLPALKEFAEKLAGEPDPARHLTTLPRILVIVFDDAFVEKIHALLMNAAKREDERLNLRYPAAQAWHEMGRTDKALALYQDAAAGKGFSPGYARAAKDMIERWETGDKERVELLGWIRARLEKLPGGRSESEELHALIRELSTSRNLPLLDRLWRTGIRAEKPDPLFLKLAALRSSRDGERLDALRKLCAAPEAMAEWRLELAAHFLGRADEAKALDAIREALGKDALPAKDRQEFCRKCVSFAWRLSGPGRAGLARDLEAAGAFRWAWELHDSFVSDHAAGLEFTKRWKTAAAAGEDRARALEAAARTLIAMDRAEEALRELGEALKDGNLSAEFRRELEVLRLGPLLRFGTAAEGVPALIRHFESDPDSPHEAWRWAGVVAGERKGVEWLNLWDAAKPPMPAAIIFAAYLEVYLERRDAALARLQEGVKRFPENAWLHHELGDFASAQEKFDVAADAYEKALIHWKPAFGEALPVREKLARALGRAGKLKAAAEILQSVREPSQRLRCAAIAEELKLHDLGAQIYREALGVQKDNVALRLSLARVLKAAGKTEEAEAEYRLILQSEGGERWRGLSGLLASMVEKKESGRIAEALLDEARRAKGGHRELEVVRSLLTTLPAEMRGPVTADWKKLADAMPEAEAVQVLSSMIVRTWQLQGALFSDGLRAALQRFPRSPSLHYEAALALRQSNRFVDAALEFQTTAFLDPRGEQTGIPAPAMRGFALTALLDGNEPETAFKVALALLAEPEGQLLARRSLLQLETQLRGAFWTELSRQRDLLPPSKAGAADTARLLRELDADEIETREAASKAWRAIGLPALRALVNLVEAPNLELRDRARNVIRSILREP